MNFADHQFLMSYHISKLRMPAPMYHVSWARRPNVFRVHVHVRVTFAVRIFERRYELACTLFSCDRCALKKLASRTASMLCYSLWCTLVLRTLHECTPGERHGVLSSCIRRSQSVMFVCETAQRRTFRPLYSGRCLFILAGVLCHRVRCARSDSEPPARVRVSLHERMQTDYSVYISQL